MLTQKYQCGHCSRCPNAVIVQTSDSTESADEYTALLGLPLLRPFLQCMLSDGSEPRNKARNKVPVAIQVATLGYPQSEGIIGKLTHAQRPWLAEFARQSAMRSGCDLQIGKALRTCSRHRPAPGARSTRHRRDLPQGLQRSRETNDASSIPVLQHCI
jgi:hypothetical protein